MIPERGCGGVAGDDDAREGKEGRCRQREGGIDSGIGVSEGEEGTTRGGRQGSFGRGRMIQIILVIGFE